MIEEDLGEKLGDAFADFEEEPLAAASIGQVYRAELHDGRRVAVKVQYPGVASAVRADLQNLGLLLRAAKRMAPGLDAKTVGGEIRERISEELDYEHEAQAQRSIARAWRGHPLRGRPGRGHEHVARARARDRVGRRHRLRGGQRAAPARARPLRRDRLPLLLRLVLQERPLLRRPAPGQLPAAGRRSRGLPRLRPDQEGRDGSRRGREGRHPGRPRGRRRRPLRAPGGARLLPPRTGQGGTRSGCSQHVQLLQSWYAEDAEFTLTREYVSNLLLQAGDPRSDYWDQMREGTIPRRRAVRAAHGGAHARRARPARRDGQLAPDHARVALRRAAVAPARRAGGRVAATGARRGGRRDAPQPRRRRGPRPPPRSPTRRSRARSTRAGRST